MFLSTCKWIQKHKWRRETILLMLVCIRMKKDDDKLAPVIDLVLVNDLPLFTWGFYYIISRAWQQQESILLFMYFNYCSLSSEIIYSFLFACT